MKKPRKAAVREQIRKVAEQVSTWPEWMRGGSAARPPEPAVDAAPMLPVDDAADLRMEALRAAQPREPAVVLKEGMAPALQDEASRRRAGRRAFLLQKLDLFIDFPEVTEALADIRRRAPFPEEQQSQSTAPAETARALNEDVRAAGRLPEEK